MKIKKGMMKKGMMKKGTAVALGSVLAIGLLLGTSGALYSAESHKVTKDTVKNTAAQSKAENESLTGDEPGSVNLLENVTLEKMNENVSDLNDIISENSGKDDGTDSTGGTSTTDGAGSAGGTGSTDGTSATDGAGSTGSTGSTDGTGTTDGSDTSNGSGASSGTDTSETNESTGNSSSTTAPTNDSTSGSTDETSQNNGTEPTVTINQTSVTVKEGESAMFSVTVSDTASDYTSESFRYQWQKKEASGNEFSAISGETSNSYTISNVQSSQNGEQYCCEVTYTPKDSTGSKTITSGAATLNVNQKTTAGPSITTDLPSSYTATTGKDVIFTIEAKAGTEGSTLTYEWFEGSSSSPITGANSNSYTISSVTEEKNNTTYYCRVTEKATSGATLGTVASQTVKLTVTAKETYTVTVNDGTAGSNAYAEGDTVSITATVPEGKTFRQWTTTTEGVTFADSKAVNTTFTMPAKNVTVTAEFDSKTTEDYSITITKQPENMAILAGGSASFTVDATVTPSAELTYQWEADYNDGKGFVAVSTEKDYTVSNVQSTLSGATYWCRVSVKDHPESYLYSSKAVLTIGYQITVNDGTASPATGNAGESITIKANTPQDGYEFKQWTVKKGNVILKDAGKAQTVFVMPASDVELTAEFQQTLAKPVIMTQPENVTVYAGETTSFKVEASGEELTYQWMLDKTDGKGFQKITGATEKVLRVYTQDGSMNGYKYKCAVTNRSGSVDSREAVLTVHYKITEGANSIWKKGSSDGLTFKGNGAYTKFRSIKIDEQYISGGNYTKKSDPTIVTMVASYLETLSTGDHNLTMVWEDGIAETVFTVTAGTSSGSSSSGSSSGSTANNSAGNAVNAAAGSSSASTAGGTDSTTASAAQQDTGETELVDMPIVSHSENAKTDTGVKETVQTKKTEQSVESYLSGGANGSVITALNGDLTKKQSKLNEYAATASIIIIIMSAVGAILVFAVRGITALYQSRKCDK